MRFVLLGLAAPLAVTLTAVVPAHAQSFDAGFSGHSAVLGGPAVSTGQVVLNGRERDHDGRHHRRARSDVLTSWGWYDPNLNSSWNSDSFNDWWHDRPDRAYPRWVWHNDNCDRMFWAGGGWRCSM